MVDTKRDDIDRRRPSAAAAAELDDIERLMDEISSQSFPASDPPAWGVVASRLDELRHGSRESETDSSPR